jgi:dTDP-4-dehydrorhamnose reductase
VSTICFDPLSDDLADIRGIETISHALFLYAQREPDECIKNPEGTSFVNVRSPCRLIDQCVDLGIVPMFASSELVFDGTEGLYTELEQPSPILEYGRQKVVVEEYLLRHAPGGLILRFPKTIGSRRGDRSLLSTWLDRLESGDRVFDCAIDQYFSLEFADDVPGIVRQLIRGGLSGIFHLGDGRRHSRPDLLAQLGDRLADRGLSVPIAREIFLADLDFLERRPPDVSLDNSKLIELLGPRDPLFPRAMEAALRDRQDDCDI